jgi:hypothetical protein
MRGAYLDIIKQRQGFCVHLLQARGGPHRQRAQGALQHARNEQAANTIIRHMLSLSSYRAIAEQWTM